MAFSKPLAAASLDPASLTISDSDREMDVSVSPMAGLFNLFINATPASASASASPNIVVCMASTDTNRCFIHPAKVTQAVHAFTEGFPGVTGGD